MSDFLRSLVARAEGRLPVLERRPRALFEPAPGQTVHAPGMPEVEAMAVVRPAAPSALGDAPLLAPGRAAAARPSGPAAAMPASAEHRAAPIREPAPVQGLLSRSTPLPPPPAAASNRPAALLATPASTPHAAAGSTATDAPQRSPLRPALRQPGADPVEARAAPRPRPVETASPAGVLRPQAAQAAPSVMLLARAQARSPAQAPGFARAAAAPVPVQISIGRLEVRAAPPAAADRPRPAGPAAPRLSLDNYLRSRNGAAR